MATIFNRRVQHRTLTGQSALCRAVMVLAACLFLASCTASGLSTPPGGAGPAIAPGADAGVKRRHARVRVALLLPLSAKGRTGHIAKALKRAGELALFEFDKPNVVLLTKDTKGTPQGTMEATSAALAEGAELVIGPLFAKHVRIAAGLTRKAGIPMIAFSSDPTVAGNGVYLLSFIAGADIARVVAFAVTNNRRRIAALIPDSPYGQVAERALRTAVARRGGELVTVEKFPLNANGMLAPARKVKQAVVNAKAQGNPIQALVIPAGKKVLPLLAQMFPYFEIDTKEVKLLGTGNWDYPNVGQEKPLIGGWYPAPDPNGWRQFTKRYVKTYSKVPPRLASLSYDAVSLVISLSTNPPGKRFTEANLTRQNGFAGVDGLFRFRRDGRPERGLAVLEVHRYGNRVVDPAPSVFSGAQF